MSRRKPKGRPLAKPIEYAPISGEACDIAISEITGIPLDALCGFVVFALKHEANNRHTPIMVPRDADLAKALRLVARAEADLRLIVERGAQL